MPFVFLYLLNWNSDLFFGLGGGVFSSWLFGRILLRSWKSWNLGKVTSPFNMEDGKAPVHWGGEKRSKLHQRWAHSTLHKNCSLLHKITQHGTKSLSVGDLNTCVSTVASLQCWFETLCNRFLFFYRRLLRADFVFAHHTLTEPRFLQQQQFVWKSCNTTLSRL